MRHETTKYNIFQYYAKQKQEGTKINTKLELSEEEKEEIREILTFQMDYLESLI
jgi:hypothetical protein